MQPTFAVVTLHITSPRCALMILAKAPRTPGILLSRPFSAIAAISTNRAMATALRQDQGQIEGH